jgi:hypothetical protein
MMIPWVIDICDDTISICHPFTALVPSGHEFIVIRKHPPERKGSIPGGRDATARLGLLQ